MSTPIDSTGAPAGPSIKLAPLALTTEEIRLVMLYRAVDPVWRADCVDYANTVSKMFPLAKEPLRVRRPAISLVRTNGKLVLK